MALKHDALTGVLCHAGFTPAEANKLVAVFSLLDYQWAHPDEVAGRLLAWKRKLEVDAWRAGWDEGCSFLTLRQVARKEAVGCGEDE